MKRNYNEEIHDNNRNYKYNFDTDVMHEYMLRTFIPFIKDGNALELGSFQGDFTRRLENIFQNITCVEASCEAVQAAQLVVDGNKVEVINDLFENYKAPCKYNNIFLTHVLEHLDDRVGLLKKIRDEWISEDGVLFIACPNANAPSRQIAFKMGLVEYNAAVTPSEYEHGHRITYTLDTLEHEIRLAGLKIVSSGGIFFKVMANFQWDQLLHTDIISKEYLDGCYELGKKYPELCSSIYFVCKK